MAQYQHGLILEVGLLNTAFASKYCLDSPPGEEGGLWLGMEGIQELPDSSFEVAKMTAEVVSGPEPAAEAIAADIEDTEAYFGFDSPEVVLSEVEPCLVGQPPCIESEESGWAPVDSGFELAADNRSVAVARSVEVQELTDAAEILDGAKPKLVDCWTHRVHCQAFWIQMRVLKIYHRCSVN